jgi:hypothetical protein
MRLPLTVLVAFSLVATPVMAQAPEERAAYEAEWAKDIDLTPRFVVGYLPADHSAAAPLKDWSVLSLTVTGVNLAVKRERADGVQQWASGATCPGLIDTVAAFERIGANPPRAGGRAREGGDLYQASIEKFPIGAHPFEAPLDIHDSGELATWTQGLLRTAEPCWQSGVNRSAAPAKSRKRGAHSKSRSSRSHAASKSGSKSGSKAKAPAKRRHR